MKKSVVCIDPGHPSYFKDGSINWGCHSNNGVREVEINLIVAELLTNLLKDDFVVLLTRNDNSQVVDNVERVRIAKKYMSQLIVRLHCDWDRRNQRSGVRIFHPPVRANAIYDQSKRCAYAIHDSIIDQTNLQDNGIWDDTVGNIDPVLGMWIGSFEADKVGIPVVLIEMVFLSSEDDTKWITDSTNQQLMAISIAEGIRKVFSTVLLGM